MVKHSLKVLLCEHRKIFKVCMTTFHHYVYNVKMHIKLCSESYSHNLVHNEPRNFQASE